MIEKIINILNAHEDAIFFLIGIVAALLFLFFSLAFYLAITR